MKNAIVITTVNQKGPALAAFESLGDGWHVVVVGDEKSPAIDSSQTLTFLSMADQEKLPFRTASCGPRSHYARKNVGYLYALAQGAELIYETDDDNLPLEEWSFPPFRCENVIEADSGFVNAYRYFTDQPVWPRGYPLEELADNTPYRTARQEVRIGVWQGLADGEPDVDAVYRLVVNEPVAFEPRPPVALARGCFCPFNTQNTLWAPELIECAYLPATVSSRFTDILRGYVAQPIMWARGLCVGFTKATVFQERNPHDLMADFRQEMDCYLRAREVAERLRTLGLSGHPSADMTRVYEELAQMGVVSQDEHRALACWLQDVEDVTGQGEG